MHDVYVGVYVYSSGLCNYTVNFFCCNLLSTTLRQPAPLWESAAKVRGPLFFAVDVMRAEHKKGKKRRIEVNQFDSLWFLPKG